LTNNIKVRSVSDIDAGFIFAVMNNEAVLDALNEIPTQLRDWQDAIGEWNRDSDEEDHIICYDGTPVGWFGINGLDSDDRTVYLKLIAILPEYHGKGIGQYVIGEAVQRLRQRGYLKIALYTDRDNRKARACYSKCGFEVMEYLTEEMSNGKTVERVKMGLML